MLIAANPAQYTVGSRISLAVAGSEGHPRAAGLRHRGQRWRTSQLPIRGAVTAGLAPGVVSHPYWRMKPRLRAQGGVANPRDSTGYRCGLRLALNANPSVSLCATMDVTRH